jgi:hypothetical protein
MKVIHLVVVFWTMKYQIKKTIIKIEEFIEDYLKRILVN